LTFASAPTRCVSSCTLSRLSSSRLACSSTLRTLRRG
jgi:hypothetical protein